MSCVCLCVSVCVCVRSLAPSTIRVIMFVFFMLEKRKSPERLFERSTGGRTEVFYFNTSNNTTNITIDGIILYLQEHISVSRDLKSLKKIILTSLYTVVVICIIIYHIPQ